MTSIAIHAPARPPRSSAHRARLELQRRLSAWLDLPLALLGLVMLVLLVLGFFIDPSSDLAHHIGEGQTAIWVIFALEFAIQLALAPSKSRYLRKNWLTAVAVVLPAFRSVRVLRAARALRGISLVRLLTTFNRAARALGHLARRGELGYVALLTLAVTLSAAAGAYYFEHDEANAAIVSAGDALWWAATLVTTMNSSLETTTFEGHVVGLLLRVYALAIAGYLTATIAVYLWGGAPAQSTAAESGDLRAVRDELASLRREVARLADAVGRARPGPDDSPGGMRGGATA